MSKPSLRRPRKRLKRMKRQRARAWRAFTSLTAPAYPQRATFACGACEKRRPGANPALQTSLSVVISDLGQRHFRHRPALGLRPRRRAPFCLRLWRRQLLGFGRHRTVEELEAELVATLFVLINDDAHVTAGLQVTKQDLIGQWLLDVLLNN